MAGWIVVPDGVRVTEDPGVEVAHWEIFVLLERSIRDVRVEKSGEIMGQVGFYGESTPMD